MGGGSRWEIRREGAYVIRAATCGRMQQQSLYHDRMWCTMQTLRGEGSKSSLAKLAIQTGGPIMQHTDTNEAPLPRLSAGAPRSRQPNKWPSQVFNVPHNILREQLALACQSGHRSRRRDRRPSISRLLRLLWAGPRHLCDVAADGWLGGDVARCIEHELSRRQQRRRWQRRLRREV